MKLNLSNGRSPPAAPASAAALATNLKTGQQSLIEGD